MNDSYQSAKSRILVVDDDKNTLRVLSRSFERIGYPTDTAETGQQALDKMENNKYSAVIIDHMLTDMNGVYLLRKIKENIKGNDMVNIMLTGVTDSGEVRELAMKEGFDEFLPKPTSPLDIISILEKRINEKNR